MNNEIENNIVVLSLEEEEEMNTCRECGNTETETENNICEMCEIYQTNRDKIANSATFITGHMDRIGIGNLPWNMGPPLTAEQKWKMLGKQIKDELLSGDIQLQKKRIQIEKQRNKFDIEEERQREAFEARIKAKRLGFEKKCKEEMHETLSKMVIEVRTLETAQETYEDTGPMLK